MTWFRVITDSGYDTATYRHKQEAIHAYETVLKGQYGDQWQKVFKTQQPRLLITTSRRAAILANIQDPKVVSCDPITIKEVTPT